MESMDRSIKLDMMIKMMEMAYATMLRQIVVDYTKGTENEVDDRLVAVLDGLFGYRA